MLTTFNRAGQLLKADVEVDDAYNSFIHYYTLMPLCLSVLLLVSEFLDNEKARTEESCAVTAQKDN